MTKRTIPVLLLMLLVPVAQSGCGSSDGKSAVPDGAVHDGGINSDTRQATDVGGKPDVAITLDTNSVDGGGSMDVPMQLDTGGLDVHTAVDAGALDVHTAVDAGAVDAHGLDGSRAIDAGTGPSQGVDAATLDGGQSRTTVTATLYNPDLQTILGGPATAVVGASNPTFPNGSILGNTAFEINVTSSQIVYRPLANVNYSGGTFNGFVFVFANAPTILGVTLDPASNFTPTKISFTGSSVSLNLSGNSVTTDSVAILDLQLD